MVVKVQIIHAFSIDGKGGNPAGVVFDADAYSKEQKQAIAAQVGYPETAFVSSSKMADFKLDFFTPLKQIAHCGHATIATFTYLKQTGRIQKDHSSKETIDGTRAIRFEGGLAFMEQRSPTLQVPQEDMPFILESVGLSLPDLIPGLEPTIVNTGNSFLIIPVKNETLLSAVQYNKSTVTTISEKYGLIGYYLFAFPENGNNDATTRMFGPFYGIEEEAGTGMAAGPLACYLLEVVKKDKGHFLIEQGRFMKVPSPSRIYVNLEMDGTTIVRLFAGGNAYVAGEKSIHI